MWVKDDSWEISEHKDIWKWRQYWMGQGLSGLSQDVSSSVLSPFGKH